ncbi:MAG: lipoyl(octanoyl) transferase LipB [Phycisphaerales bacterium]
MDGRTLRVVDLGRLPYAPACRVQGEHLDEVLASREAATPEVGRLLLVEHDPVVTIGRRPGSARHLTATPEQLARHGVAVAESDRGGDVTYHGPGQVVAYPILDLNVLGLGLHAYMRMLESVVIDALAAFGVRGERDTSATGVWVRSDHRAGGPAKIAAMGVRVRRWVSMHGLALNVSTNPEHFGLIVACGLAGRSVTNLSTVLGTRCPSMDEVKRALVASMIDHVERARREAVARRAAAAVGSNPPSGVRLTPT